MPVGRGTAPVARGLAEEHGWLHPHARVLYLHETEEEASSGRCFMFPVSLGGFPGVVSSLCASPQLMEQKGGRKDYIQYQPQRLKVENIGFREGKRWLIVRGFPCSRNRLPWLEYHRFRISEPRRLPSLPNQ